MKKEEFLKRYAEELNFCSYKMHDEFNIFNPANGLNTERLLKFKKEITRKYEIFYTIAKILKPKKIIELGFCMGNGADAYLSASRDSILTGYDILAYTPEQNNFLDGWIDARGFENRFKLVFDDLRNIRELPKADLVVVDADHSFYHAYNDLCLAMTAKPEWIWADDATEETNTKPAIERFLYDFGSCKYTEIINGEKRDNIDWETEIDFESPHFGGGRLIHLKY